MKPLESLMGNFIAENISESVELNLLKQRLSMYLEKLTQDEETITKINRLFDTMLNLAQTESKFDGFIAGLEVAKNDL